MADWVVFLHFFFVPLCWYTVSERKMLLIFCEKFIWSRQTSLSNGFSGYFRDSTIESIFFVLLLANVDVIRKQKQQNAVKNTKENLMSSISKLKDSRWCACFITRWHVFYRCVQLMQGVIMLISSTIIFRFNFEKNISYVFLFLRNFKISFPSVFTVHFVLF